MLYSHVRGRQIYYGRTDTVSVKVIRVPVRWKFMRIVPS